MAKLFENVGGLRPKKSYQNISYDKKLTCDMGQLIPIVCDEVVPGDVLKISNQALVRMQPLVAPVMHDVYFYTHYFFVPYRLLWKDWEEFITGGKKGDFDLKTPPPQVSNKTTSTDYPNGIAQKYSLWDYLGFPILSNDTPLPVEVCKFPFDAYNMVYNEFYRDETLQDKIGDYDTDEELSSASASYSIKNRAWRKDYFTSALESQQRGTAPAFVFSNLSATLDFGSDFNAFSQLATLFNNSDVSQGSSGSVVAVVNNSNIGNSYQNDNQVRVFTSAQNPPNPDLATQLATAGLVGAPPTYQRKLGVYLNPDEMTTIDSYIINLLNSASLSSDGTASGGFNISDLRLLWQIQKFMERNNRAGYRYTEFLRAHFGVTPTDARLNRPEYIGGTSSPVLFNEVLQTSATESGSTPLAEMAGRGISVSNSYVGKYRVKEFGLIIGIMSVMPKATYQQGINRQWLRRTRYDFYFPEFAHLSEQDIRGREIYAVGDEQDDLIFGFQGRYDEMRHKTSMVCGDMRDTFSYWHLGRVFENRPLLNSSFIECNPSKRIFAVQNEQTLIVWFGNVIHSLRPLPKIGEPGLVDHF